MGLTSTPDINHTTELSNSSSHIEKKHKGLNDLNNTINSVNSKLDGLRLELPKTNTEKLQKASSRLHKNEDFKWAIENVFNKGVTEHYINDNLFSVFDNETNDINFFYDNNGKILLLVDYREKDFVDNDKKFLKISIETFKKTGYFMDSENGTKNIYKIVGENSDGTFILENNPLDKNSTDYFNALKTMINYNDTFFILYALKYNKRTGKSHINDYINSGALNLKFLQLFKNKNILDSKNTFEYAIKNMNITVQDIVNAKNKGDITEEEGREIYNILQKSEVKSLD